MMKIFMLVALFFVAGSLFAQDASVPEIKFKSVPDFIKLPPDMYLGEVSGVAVNSKGHVFVLSRGNTTGPAYAASAAQLLEFDHDASQVASLREIKRSIGAGAVRCER